MTKQRSDWMFAQEAAIEFARLAKKHSFLDPPDDLREALIQNALLHALESAASAAGAVTELLEAYDKRMDWANRVTA